MQDMNNTPFTPGDDVHPRRAPERSAPPHRQPARRAPQPARKRHSAPARKRDIVICYTLRTLMVLFTTILLLFASACILLNSIFNGPSIAARNVLTMSLIHSSGTYWIPNIFMSDELVNEIRDGDKDLLPPDDSVTDIQIDTSGSLNGNSDEWKEHPDGIRIDTIYGDTFTGHVMIVRDPSKVYLATSAPSFSPTIPGERITNMMDKTGAVAGINAGAFFDNGTSDISVGATPKGLVISDGKVVWEDTSQYNSQGFVGFNEDNVLVVTNSISTQKAKDLKIRDGCCFGPILVSNGAINEQAYGNESGFNPRTAIGQRADGAIVMVCIDGRQVGNLGGGYSDMIDIMVEYGAVNACNLDGGSSSVMMYRDTQGIYGAPGQVQMINNYSLLQGEPRRMPTFFLVRP